MGILKFQGLIGLVVLSLSTSAFLSIVSFFVFKFKALEILQCKFMQQCLIAWGFSENREKVDFRVIAGCLFLQIVIALLFLSPLTALLSQKLFWGLNKIALVLQESSKADTNFVFGYVTGDASRAPFEITNKGNLFILGFQALPLVLLISVLSSILFYWRILPLIVRCVAFILKKATGISGALGLSVSANIFLEQKD